MTYVVKPKGIAAERRPQGVGPLESHSSNAVVSMQGMRGDNGILRATSPKTSALGLAALASDCFPGTVKLAVIGPS